MRLLLATCLATAAVIGGSGLKAQELDRGFDPDVANGSVQAMAVDVDGRLLIGGPFTEVGGLTRTRVARLNADGSVDPAFDADVANGAVAALLVDGAGDYVIGGSFTTVTGLTRNRIARLDALGSIDAGFSPNVNGDVHALAEEPGLQRIYAAGAFTAVNGTDRALVARFNVDGSLDSSFVPPDFTGVARAIAVQPDGKVLIGGDLGVSGVAGARQLYRLDVDGSLDSSFEASIGAGGGVHGVGIEADGRIVIAGEFSAVDGQPRSRMARLHPDGSLDLSYAPPALNDTVRSLRLQPDGRAVIGGAFTALSQRNGLARLNHDGSLDGQFSTLLATNSSVLALAVHPDGTVYFGGSFTEVSGVARNRLARTNLAGSLDTGFSATLDLDLGIFAVATQPDGRIVIGGGFTTVQGEPRVRMARLMADGTLDSGFVADFNATVQSVAVLADGKLMAAGGFTTVNGQSRPRVARLNADGSLDASFNAQMSQGTGTVQLVSPLRDGKVLLGGAFTVVAGQARERLARLLPDGGLDPDFLSFSLDGNVNALSILPDDRVLFGGDFTQFGTTALPRLGRLDSTGALDESFVVDLDSSVGSIAPTSDGDLILGGNFNQIGAAPRERFARVSPAGVLRDDDTQFDNRIESILPMRDGQTLVAGRFNRVGPGTGIVHRYLALLDADSALAAGYDADMGSLTGAVVRSLALQADGRLLVAGSYPVVGGEPRPHLVRLQGRGPVTSSLAWAPATGTVTWRTEGEAAIHTRRPELLIATACCDAAAFVPVASDPRMQPDGDGFRFLGLEPPTGLFYLRVRTVSSDGASRGTSLHLSPAHQFFAPVGDTLFANGFESP